MSGNEHILFLTGRNAEASLVKVLAEMAPQTFTYEVRCLAISVAGLMTADWIGRHLAPPIQAERVIVPGRCRGDLEALGRRMGVPFVRGPDELKDLPQFFGREERAVDLSQHDIQIFAEIVDAAQSSVERIVARGRDLARDGADVIDLGCLPDTPFPHLEESIAALHEAGLRVSVDSMNTEELRRAGRAGADYLLSLKEETLSLLDEVGSTPILIPSRPDDLDSLERAVEALQRSGRSFLADPILDPIQFGFTRSLLRYEQVRRRFAGVPILMGTGNVTELTDADSSGVTAVLLGIASELRLNAILTTEVAPHCRRAVREADWARRLMFAARQAATLPRGFTDALLTVHGRSPFPYSRDEIEAFAAEVRDPNFRVQVSKNGIHIYNRDGLHTATDPFELFPHLGVEDDGGHAFYLGVELARAQIAWQLGRRYEQDEELDWGCAVERAPEDKRVHRGPGTTLIARRQRLRRASS